LFLCAQEGIIRAFRPSRFQWGNNRAATAEQHQQQGQLLAHPAVSVAVGDWGKTTTGSPGRLTPAALAFLLQVCAAQAQASTLRGNAAALARFVCAPDRFHPQKRQLRIA